MRNIYVLLLVLFAIEHTNAQNGNVGIGTNTPNASAKLDITATNKGVLFPNVALTGAGDVTTITSPAVGLIVWNTGLGGLSPAGFYYNSGTSGSPSWTKVANGAILNSTLTNGNIWIGNASNVATEQTLSGDVTISNSGVTTIQDNSVDGTDIALGSANGDLMYYNGTDWVVLPAGTTGQILQTNGVGAPTWVANVAANAWLINGNVGTIESNFIGTIDDEPLKFRVNNFPAGRISSYGITFLGYHAGGNTSPALKNTAIGYDALHRNTTADNNTAIGHSAMWSNTTGYLNTAIGVNALQRNETGFANTATGYHSLDANNGSYNTATGVQSLLVNTEGYENTAIGFNSLFRNNTGDRNTAAGVYSLKFNTASDNTATGWYALSSNISGSYNTALGVSADVSSDNLTNATAIGANATVNASNKIQLGDVNVTNVNTSGKYTAGAVTYPNTHGAAGKVLSTTGSGELVWATQAAGADNLGNHIATDTLNMNTNPIFNITNAFASNWFVNTTSGYGLYNSPTQNHFYSDGGNWNIGNQMTYPGLSLRNGYGGQVYGSFYGNVNGVGILSGAGQWAFRADGATNSVNTGISLFVNNYTAGKISQDGATFIGYQAGNINTALKNAGFGYEALSLNTTGNWNTAIGYQALSTNSIGYDNTATGYQALYSNTTGFQNTATGNSSLNLNTTGFYNTAAGYSSLNLNTTGFLNTATGNGSLSANTTGNHNTANGVASLITNSLGSYNTANGVNSLFSNTTGNFNTANGYQSLFFNNTGSENTANGRYALISNTTGSNNTALGSQADVSSNNLTNATAIGANATVNASNKIQLGDGSVTSVNTSGKYTAGAVTYPNTDGAAGQVLSTNGSGIIDWIPQASGADNLGNHTATQTLNMNTNTIDNIGQAFNNGWYYSKLEGYGLYNEVSQVYLYSRGNSYTIAKSGGDVGLVLRSGYDGPIYGYFNGNTQGVGIRAGSGDWAFRADGATGAVNTAISLFVNNYTAGKISQDGATFIGYQAGNINLATGNTGIGLRALFFNTTGEYNTATGAYALQKNTTGFRNTANGLAALSENTTGYYNTANGMYSLAYNTTGSQNTANGYDALQANDAGSNNVANGVKSLFSNFAGSNNTATGTNALFSNTTGNRNTAMGESALSGNAIGNNNTALGYNASVQNGDLNNATAIGSNAIVTASNKIQLGDGGVTSVNTSGKYTAGTVTYPNIDGAAGQILSTNGSGTLGWIPQAAGADNLGNHTATQTLNMNTNTIANIGQAFNNGWYYSSLPGYGLYNESTQAYLYSTGNSWSIAKSGTEVGIVVRQGYEGPKYGYFYGNTQGVGILAGNGDIAFRADGATDAVNTAISLFTDNTQRVWLNSTGMGIGAAPAYKLDVNGVVNAATGFKVAGGTPSTSTYLKGNGTNFVAGTILAADIPDISGSYIKNQTSQQAASNFNVSGAGVVGTTMQAASYIFPAPTGDGSPTITARTVPVGQGNASEKTELIMFHSNDITSQGPDQITLRAPALSFQTYNDGSVYNIDNDLGYNERMYIDPNGRVGIGTISPSFKLQVPSGKIGTDYINTSDNAVSSGVTGIMVKQGDNDHKTADAASVRTFLGISNSIDWSLTGNAGTVDGTNFIGTTDNVPFNIKVNNEKAGRISSTGATFFGYQAGNINAGSGNTGIGFQALKSNITGNNNTANGYNALNSNTTGSANIAIGYNSLDSNTIGNDNIAIGVDALQSNTTGNHNYAIGQFSLLNNTTGNSNIGIGASALLANTIGYYNTANGQSALFNNTTGINNTGFGAGALFENRTGSYNTAIGWNAGPPLALQNLSNTTAIGYNALVDASDMIQLGDVNVTKVNTSGKYTAGAVTYPNIHGAAGKVLSTTGSGELVWVSQPNVAATAWSLTGNAGTVDGTNFIGTTDNVPLNIRVNGVNAGRITSGAIFIGYQAGNSNINDRNTGFGREVLKVNTTGYANTANGYYALTYNTEGSQNTAAGFGALQYNLTGNYNTANGSNALNWNTTGIQNTATGAGALGKNTLGSNNTASGMLSLTENTEGGSNTASGYASLTKNTLGNGNTATGNASLLFNIDGNNNTANGMTALQNNSTGDNNTATGLNALVTNTTGSNNTALGSGANVTFNNLTNATAIGSNATVNASNKIQLGNGSVTSVNTSGKYTSGTVTYPNTDGAAGQVLSTNGSGIIDWVPQASGADNLGNHTATETLKMNAQQITNIGEAYNNGWYRNNTSGFGLYNEATNNRFYSDGAQWNIAKDGPNTGLILRLADGIEAHKYGTLYGNEIGFGLVNGAGQWVFKSDAPLGSPNTSISLFTENTQRVWINSTGMGIGAAPSYKLDVQGTTGIRIGNGNYDANLVFGNTPNWRSGIRVYDNSNAEMRIYAAHTDGKIVLATGYDGYESTTLPTDGLWVNHNKVGIGIPAPTRKLEVNGDIKLASGYQIYFGEDVTTNGKVGINFHTEGSSDYGIYKPAGAWTSPYPPLHIAFATGIKIGANYEYGGTKFYNNSNMLTEIMSVGAGDNHVRIGGYLYAGYVNTTDDASNPTAVSGILVKKGDNYHRTADAASVRTFLGITAPTGDNLGNHTATTTLNMNANTITNITEAYATGWYRNTSSGVGLYNQSDANHFYSTGSIWNMGGPAEPGLRLHANYNGAVYGTFYGDGEGVGILNGVGSWAILAKGVPNATNTSIELKTDNTERVRINSTGMGIGTTSINARLIVVAAGESDQYVARFGQSNTTPGNSTFIGLGTEGGSWSKAAIGFQRTGSYDMGDLTFNVSSDNTSSSGATESDERMRIRSNGNVGIGTTLPAAKLDVQGTTGLRIGNGNYDANLVFGNNATWRSGIRVYDNANAEMRIYAANTLGQIVLATGYDGYESTTLPTDGLWVKNNNVGIGNFSATAIDQKLKVLGNISANYISTPDNGVISGVTGIMVKTGTDNFHRTATAAAVRTFLNITAPNGDNLGNHTATNTLDMDYYDIDNAYDINAISSINSYDINSTIFYDSDDPSYYCDPEWTSNFNTVNTSEIYNNGWFRSNNLGTGWYNQASTSGIYAPNPGEVATYNGSYFRITGAGNGSGNLRFDAANPYIYASSYFHAPGGAYFNSGTVYAEADMRLRGGLSNDGGNFGGDLQVNDNLRITGTVSCLGGYCPSNSAIRLTPNLHLNSNAGNAVILNWNNGSSGNSSVLRIGNGAGSDVFQVWAGQGNTGINKAPDANYKLDAYDADFTAGSNYAQFFSRAVINGHDLNSQSFEFGSGGWAFNDYPRSGGVIGSQYNASYWSSLGYKNSGSTGYGCYYTSVGSGGGFLPENITTGIGTGGYGGVIGSWTRGEVMGQVSAGELFAGYNLGNVYTSGHQADLITVNNKKVAAYSSTSPYLQVSNAATGNLINGKATILFDENFAGMLDKESTPIVTVTPIGDCNGIHIVSMNSSGFTIEENKSGNSNVMFTYIVIGKRVDAASAELPADIADIDFDDNMKGVMFNENDLEHSATPIWWDGQHVRFDKAPDVKIDKSEIISKIAKEKANSANEVNEAIKNSEKNMVITGVDPNGPSLEKSPVTHPPKGEFGNMPAMPEQKNNK